MSKPGVAFAATILSQMQQARIALLRGDNQDIRLGQLFEDAKDCIKDRFAEIAAEAEMEGTG